MTNEENGYDVNKMNEIILAPYYHVKQVGSNDILTSKLTEALNYWLNIPKEKIKAIQDIAGLITQTVILFDDIQDNTKYRRNISAAHCVYGVPLTINASLQVLGLAMKKITELGHPQAAGVFCDQFLSMIHGQGTEIYWRENFRCPSEEEYKQMTSYKTSYLWMVLHMMQLFSDNKSDYSKFFTKLGLYYQIRDEYCNLCKIEGVDGKSRAAEFKDLSQFHYCEDITEGRLSWPVIHGLRSSKATEILNILKQRTHDVHTKRYCVSLLEEVGSLKYTRDTLRSLDHDLRMELHKLGNNPLMEEFLAGLYNWESDAD